MQIVLSQIDFLTRAQEEVKNRQRLQLHAAWLYERQTASKHMQFV